MAMDSAAWRIAWLSAALVFILGVGLIDANVDPNIGFALLYLLPVVAMAWKWGLGFAMAAAGLSALVRFAAALAGRGPDMLPTVLWNSLNHLAVFAATGLAVALLRRERELLVDLLGRETTMARTDPVTGLPNWLGLSEHLRREISRSRRQKQPLCIGYLDLDNFKLVNDKHGHGQGDSLLRKIGSLLRQSVRPEDLVFRVGGDEFVLAFNSPDPAAAESLGQRLIARIGLLGREYPGCNLGASLGVVCFTKPPDKPEELVTRADQVMYQVKKHIKGTIRVVVDDGKERPYPKPDWWMDCGGIA